MEKNYTKNRRTQMNPQPAYEQPIFKSKEIICTECHASFIFSADEQEFFHNRGLLHQPKRCSSCRLIMRLRREGKSVLSTYQVDCAQCGEKTTVPFQPKGYKPVLCPACFADKD